MKRSLVLLLGLTSCFRMGPGTDLDYCAPETWKTPLACEEDCSSLTCSRDWWLDFQDPCLDQLEQQAIANNLDLQIAAMRVLEAKALLGIAFSERVPQVSLDPNYTYENATATLADVGLKNKKVRVRERQVSFPLDVSYEVDLWGKYRNQEAAARERFFASEFNQSAVFLSLTTEVATIYYTIRTLDDEIRFLEQAVKVREDLIDINTERLKCGLDSDMDVSRTKLDYQLAVSDLEDAKRLRGKAENALALILGTPASCFTLASGTLPENIPCPPPGMPSDLILRRPDVLQKMHLAMAALDEIGVAYADFFPQFSLIGNTGFINPSFAHVFEWQSGFWAFAVNLSQYIFDGGRRCDTLALRQAEYLEHIYDYRKQTLIAFQEVEDALNEIMYRRNQADAQMEAVIFAVDTSHLARNQYNSGLINYLFVSDAEKTELNTRIRSIRLNGSVYLAAIQLVKALGGGFGNPQPVCADQL